MWLRGADSGPTAYGSGCWTSRSSLVTLATSDADMAFFSLRRYMFAHCGMRWVLALALFDSFRDRAQKPQLRWPGNRAAQAAT